MHRVCTRGMHEANTKILTPFFDTIFNFNQSRDDWIRKCKPLSRGGWITKGLYALFNPHNFARGMNTPFFRTPQYGSMIFKIFQLSIFCRNFFYKNLFLRRYLDRWRGESSFDGGSGAGSGHGGAAARWRESGPGGLGPQRFHSLDSRLPRHGTPLR